jgi:hypothetical protein
MTNIENVRVRLNATVQLEVAASFIFKTVQYKETWD